MGNEKTVKENSSIWWNPSKIMSYNCLFNFIVGSTGCGKGFAMTEMLIKKALYENKQFIYLRRSDVEQKLAKTKFFDDMIANDKFPGWAFKCTNDNFLAAECDPDTGEVPKNAVWKTIGYARYLSGARQQKSVNTPRVWAIWFDEFILPKKDWGKYINDEVYTFLRFYDTVARMRDVRVFFISNAESLVNPYFLYFNIHIPYNTDICRIKEDVAFEMVDNPAFREVRRNTRFGKLIEGTEYGNYAIENSFGTARHSDIAKLDKTFWYSFSIVYKDYKIGVYRSDENQQIILSFKFDETFKPRFELTVKDGKLNKTLISIRDKNYYLNALFKWYINGFVYYDSVSVKQAIEPVLDKLM